MSARVDRCTGLALFIEPRGAGRWGPIHRHRVDSEELGGAGWVLSDFAAPPTADAPSLRLFPDAPAPRARSRRRRRNRRAVARHAAPENAQPGLNWALGFDAARVLEARAPRAAASSGSSRSTMTMRTRRTSESESCAASTASRSGARRPSTRTRAAPAEREHRGGARAPRYVPRGALASTAAAKRGGCLARGRRPDGARLRRRRRAVLGRGGERGRRGVRGGGAAAGQPVGGAREELHAGEPRVRRAFVRDAGCAGRGAVGPLRHRRRPRGCAAEPERGRVGGGAARVGGPERNTMIFGEVSGSRRDRSHARARIHTSYRAAPRATRRAMLALRRHPRLLASRRGCDRRRVLRDLDVAARLLHPPGHADVFTSACGAGADEPPRDSSTRGARPSCGSTRRRARAARRAIAAMAAERASTASRLVRRRSAAPFAAAARWPFRSAELPPHADTCDALGAPPTTLAADGAFAAQLFVLVAGVEPLRVFVFGGIAVRAAAVGDDVEVTRRTPFDSSSWSWRTRRPPPRCGAASRLPPPPRRRSPRCRRGRDALVVETPPPPPPPPPTRRNSGRARRRASRRWQLMRATLLVDAAALRPRLLLARTGRAAAADADDAGVAR